MEANNVNAGKKADVLNRIKELSRKKVNRNMIFGVVFVILAIAFIVYDFLLDGENQSHYYSSNIPLFICGIILIYCSIVYKRIGQANTSTEMNSLLKKVEIGPTGSLILAIVFIVIGLAISTVMIYESLNTFGSLDWVEIVLIAFVVILFFGLALLLLINRGKFVKSDLRLLIDELQALEEEK